jgi:hypothetical protein
VFIKKKKRKVDDAKNADVTNSNKKEPAAAPTGLGGLLGYGSCSDSD